MFSELSVASVSYTHLDVYKRQHINKARLNRILSLLKTLKPAGIFAHDLRECLLLQLMEQHPENELARRLTEHLEALARGGTTS